MITLRCPWDSPPLRSNQRFHWAAKAKLTKHVRTDAAQASTAWAWANAKPDEYPVMEQVTVTLVWEVTDKRRRDVGAAAPTLKAWIDGMVDGGLLAGDHYQIVTEERLRIEVGTRKGVRVEIEPAERTTTT